MKKYIKHFYFSLLFRKESRAGGNVRFERIYHNHIRKCGGTSINEAIIKSIGGNNETIDELAKHNLHKIDLSMGSCVAWNVEAINRESFLYAFSHEPLHRLTLDDSTFTFCFLRDPAQRVISHFNMLKALIDDGIAHPALTHEKNFAFGDFDHFLDNIPSEHLQAQLFNFSSSYNTDEAIYNLCSRINYVCDFKDPEKELLPFLSSEFGLNVEYHHLHASKIKFMPTSDQYTRLEAMLSEEIKFVKRAERYLGFNLKA